MSHAIKRFVLGYKLVFLAYQQWKWFVFIQDTIVWSNNIAENLLIKEMEFESSRSRTFNMLTKNEEYKNIDFIARSVDQQILRYNDCNNKRQK